jgi:general secretion pathway protein H
MMKGFTLIELTVALAIAALLLVVVMPSGSYRYGAVALQGSARDVAAALRLTRSRAITANREAEFALDLANAVYRPAGAAAPVALPRDIRIVLFTAEDERLSGTVGAIRFFPDGSSSGGDVALSRGGERYDVLVDWLTGGVSIHERR